MLSAFILGAGLSVLPACSSTPYFHSLFHGSRTETAEDARFRSEYPHLKELLRQNNFRQALEWVNSWEKGQSLSDENLRLLRKDRRTIQLIGSAYYMGVARERKKAGRYHGALTALKIAQGFSPADPLLRREILKARARIIVQGEVGQDWSDMVQRLLALKAKNPSDSAIDPTISWAYAGLAGSEFTSGHYDLAYAHSHMALSYNNKEDKALTVRDRVSEIVNGIVGKAEAAYRRHLFDEARTDLERALTIDPDSKRARKDWRILSETLKMPTVPSNVNR